MTTGPETVNIPPHPRILRALAEIDFDRGQCIAELIDNGFDEFLDIERSGNASAEALRVHVVLPNTASGKVVISDNGRGMPLEQITDAVRAGYSGNDPLSKLGLFGMGFNVATARLGRVTTFLSTRRGDTEWVGVRIDIQEMGEDFAVPVVRVPKTDVAEHGTRIEIGVLTPLARQFTVPGNRTRLRAQLGAIYSYLLAERGYELIVDQTPVTAYRHCTWSAERAIIRAGETIPARIEIDETLPPMKVCRTCGGWQDMDNTSCQQCGAADLVERERRVHGWLGIARELDTKQFGIDFLRNGRKILRFDRRLFEWVDPDDASGAPIAEYPLEIPYTKGRIVGEIHLDHVRVSYTKDAFDFSDRAWKTAVRVIRGETSLLPKTATARGDAPNDSPLARLHRGYRRNDPGTNYLTAGDGNSRFDTADWVAAFYKGEAEYQDDTKWWNAAVEHDRLKDEIKLDKERRKRQQEQSDRDEREDPTSEFFGEEDGGGGHDGGGRSMPQAPAPTPPPRRPLTDLDRWVIAVLALRNPVKRVLTIRP
jgi:ribosomal protein L40E